MSWFKSSRLTSTGSKIHFTMIIKQLRRLSNKDSLLSLSNKESLSKKDSLLLLSKKDSLPKLKKKDTKNLKQEGVMLKWLPMVISSDLILTKGLMECRTGSTYQKLLLVVNSLQCGTLLLVTWTQSLSLENLRFNHRNSWHEDQLLATSGRFTSSTAMMDSWQG